MRVLGGHDYYDSALAHGRDPNLVFVRGQSAPVSPETAQPHGIAPLLTPRFRLREAGKDREAETAHGGWRFRGLEIRLWECCAVVAGVRYQGVRMAVESRGGLPRTLQDDFHWTREGLLKALDDCGVEIEERPARRFLAFSEGEKAESLEAYFAPHTYEGRARDFLVSSRIAVMTRVAPCEPLTFARAATFPWEVNEPNLGDLAFYKALDPYTAFQELAMWVGNLPAPGPDTVEPEDRVRKWKKGFDEKSFRKPPQGG